MQSVYRASKPRKRKIVANSEMSAKKMNQSIRKVLRDTHRQGPATARRVLNKRKLDALVTADEIAALSTMEKWRIREDRRRQNKLDECVERESKIAAEEGREMRPMLVWIDDQTINPE